MERVEFLRDEMANMVWAIEQYAGIEARRAGQPRRVSPFQTSARWRKA